MDLTDFGAGAQHIAGRVVTGRGGERFRVVNPADGSTVDIDNDLHTNELLAYFGGGVEAEWGSQQVFFEARYSQGLINAGRGNPASAASLPPEFKNTGLQFVAGWKVWP